MRHSEELEGSVVKYENNRIDVSFCIPRSTVQALHLPTVASYVLCRRWFAISTVNGDEISIIVAAVMEKYN